MRRECFAIALALSLGATALAQSEPPATQPRPAETPEQALIRAAVEQVMKKVVEEAVKQAVTTRPADTPEMAAVRDAAKAFATNLYGDDFEPVRAAFAGAKEDLEVVRSLHEMMKASREMYAAVDRKFPAGADDPVPDSGFQSLKEFAASIDWASIEVTGEAASIESTRLRKIDGKWKVVDLDPSAKDFISAFAPAVLRMSAGVQAGLKEGKFKSRQEVADFMEKAAEEESWKRDPAAMREREEAIQKARQVDREMDELEARHRAATQPAAK